MQQKLNFQIHGDERGSLISLENLKNIPFVIKRVYYIFGNKDGVARGFHAHKKLKQVLVCVNGSCKIKLDNGVEQQTITLSSPDEGILIDSFVWREMFDFSKDAVLLVLASEFYDESDYIRNYNDFKKIVNKDINNMRR